MDLTEKTKKYGLSLTSILSLLVVTAMLSGCAVTVPFSKSILVADTSSSVWTEWRGSTAPWTFGQNACYTTRKAIIQGPYRIAVVVQKPDSGICQFSSLHLVVGNYMIPLSGVRGFKDTSDGKAITWAGSTGILFFDADRIFSEQQLTIAGIWEDQCTDTSCLTDSSRIDRTRLPKQPLQMKSNRGMATMMPGNLYRKSYEKVDEDPIAQQGFITLFTGMDPDMLIPQIVTKFRQSLLDKGDWNSLVMAWEQTPNKQVLEALSKEAKKASKTRELESIVLASIPLSAVFETTPISLKNTQGKRVYESGKVDIQKYTKSFKGSSIIRITENSPIKLLQNKYSIRVTYTLVRDIERFGAGWFTGNSEHSQKTVVTKTLELSPENKYTMPVDVDFGELVIAYADRGSMGGYTRERLAKDIRIGIVVNSATQVK